MRPAEITAVAHRLVRVGSLVEARAAIAAAQTAGDRAELLSPPRCGGLFWRALLDAITAAPPTQPPPRGWLDAGDQPGAVLDGLAAGCQAFVLDELAPAVLEQLSRQAAWQGALLLTRGQLTAAGRRGVLRDDSTQRRTP